MPTEKITFYMQEDDAANIDNIATILGLKRNEVIKSSLSDISSKDFDDMCYITKLDYLEKQSEKCIKFFEMKPIIVKDDISKNFPAYVIDWGKDKQLLRIKYPTYAVKILNAKDNNDHNRIKDLIKSHLPGIYETLEFILEPGALLTTELHNGTYRRKIEDEIFFKIYFMEYQKSKCGNVLKINHENANLVKQILEKNDFLVELWGEKYLLDYPIEIFKIPVNTQGDETTAIRIK